MRIVKIVAWIVMIPSAIVLLSVTIFTLMAVFFPSTCEYFGGNRETSPRFIYPGYAFVFHPDGADFGKAFADTLKGGETSSTSSTGCDSLFFRGYQESKYLSGYVKYAVGAFGERVGSNQAVSIPAKGSKIDVYTSNDVSMYGKEISISVTDTATLNGDSLSAISKEVKKYKFKIVPNPSHKLKFIRGFYDAKLMKVEKENVDIPFTVHDYGVATPFWVLFKLAIFLFFTFWLVLVPFVILIPDDKKKS